MDTRMKNPYPQQVTAVALIEAERQRQIEREGWTPEHDDAHSTGDLATAAACYALPPGDDDAFENDPPELWPWEAESWKPLPDDRIRELVKAGALIVAEIERLQRAGADHA